MPDSRARVVLADDHLMFVRSLERLLEADVDVVRTVGDGRSLLAAAERPDVVVCDISMPKMDGLEATRRLVERDPEVKVVMLSMHADAAHVRAAFRAGARAYVVKHAAPEELLIAIEQVLQGHDYVSPAVIRGLVSSFEEGGSRADAPAADDPLLSPREREVLALVARGWSNPRIADRLSISEATLRSHLSHLYAKLGFSNRVELALYGVKAEESEQGEDREQPTSGDPTGVI